MYFSIDKGLRIKDADDDASTCEKIRQTGTAEREGYCNKKKSALIAAPIQ